MPVTTRAGAKRRLQMVTPSPRPRQRTRRTGVTTTALVSQRRLRHLGHRVGTGTTKISTVNIPTQDQVSGLYQVGDFCQISEVDQGNAQLNRRERDIIDLKAIKYSYRFQNRGLSPLMVNTALLVAYDSGGAGSGGFFRTGQAGQRGVDFDFNLSATDIHTLPVNTSKYDVLHRESFILGPNGQTNQIDGGTRFNDATPNWKLISKYMPVNRQIRYQDNGSPETRIVLVIWAVHMDHTPGTPFVGGTARFSYEGRNDSYFHDVL